MCAKKNSPFETPMMKQYLTFKDQHPDAILFFRLGDFYEMFFEDAVTASEILGITLTSRHKDAEIPMAGIPYHSAEGYIKKLLDEGKKVAVCEQIGKPDKKKKMVERKIVRVLTPGTVVEESSLEDSSSNYLMSVSTYRRSANIFWVDVSCGDVFYSSVEKEALEDSIRKISPREIILADKNCPVEGTPIDSEEFKYWVPSPNASGYIERHENLFSENRGLENAFLSVLYYLDKLYFGEFPPLREPSAWNDQETVGLDYNTIANLEIERTLIGGHTKGSFIWAIDRTVTPLGKRHLRNIVKVPLKNRYSIEARLDTVEYLLGKPHLLDEVHRELHRVKDMERLLSRLLVKRGGPREIVALCHSILAALRIREKAESNIEGMRFLRGFLAETAISEDEVRAWMETFVEEPPLNYRDGGFIDREHSEEIGQLLRIINNSRELLLEMEERERAKTGIPKLKIGYTRVFGYYIEVSRRFSEKVPDHYVRKQTTANSERYFTGELKELEEKILNAREILTEKELSILEETVCSIGAIEERIHALSKFIAWIDLFASFASLAMEQGYERPKVEEEDGIHIEDGRHPVIEIIQGREGYVPASLSIGKGASRMNIITGPNMGGKSTLMRKVALITLMAQIGSFIPAKSAKIGIVDSIFTRVGASDNLSKGESTFLVEMKETSYILNNATRRSLIILDEIGRGTGTYDGISLARAIAEHIVEKIGAVTLFATHYHILTELSEDYPSVRNYHMAVREYAGGIKFLYQLAEGGSSRSFGVEVARLAEMPRDVIKRAEKTLKNLEKTDRRVRFESGGSMQLDIFSMASSVEEPDYIPKLREMVKDNPPDNISPREALLIYYDIAKLMEDDS